MAEVTFHPGAYGKGQSYAPMIIARETTEHLAGETILINPKGTSMDMVQVQGETMEFLKTLEEKCPDDETFMKGLQQFGFVVLKDPKKDEIHKIKD